MTYAIRFSILLLPVSLVACGCNKPDSSDNYRADTSRQSSAHDERYADSSSQNDSRTIELAPFREHAKTNSAVIIDARSPDQFSKGHVRGALNVPAGRVDENAGQISGISKDSLILLYCGSSSCGAPKASKRT